MAEEMEVNMRSSCKLALIMILPTLVPLCAIAQLPRLHAPAGISRASAKQPRPEPCWQQAGISKAAMQEQRSLQQSTQAEIRSVCANDSLTPQQQREQIRAIREHTQRQIDAIISPQQREALRACQQARNAAHPGGGGLQGALHGHGQGPCGELSEAKGPPVPHP